MNPRYGSNARWWREIARAPKTVLRAPNAVTWLVKLSVGEQSSRISEICRAQLEACSVMYCKVLTHTTRLHTLSGSPVYRPCDPNGFMMPQANGGRGESAARRRPKTQARARHSARGERTEVAISPSIKRFFEGKETAQPTWQSCPFKEGELSRATAPARPTNAFSPRLDARTT